MKEGDNMDTQLRVQALMNGEWVTIATQDENTSVDVAITRKENK